MCLLSKKSFIIILFFSSFYSIYSESLSINHGLSIANITYHITNKDSYGSVDFFRYRIIEENSGLGCSIYLMNQGLTKTTEAEYNGIFNNEERFFDLEVNWEPLYQQDYPFGAGLFYRTRGFISSDERFHRFGIRGDFRLPFFFPHFIYTPLITTDFGYCMDEGIYFELKTDLLADFYFIVLNNT